MNEYIQWWIQRTNTVRGMLVMEKCWVRLKQRGPRRYPIFLPTVSIYTCKYRHTHTELGSRLWAQPSLHLEYKREKVGKWTQGTVVQHLPTCLSSPTCTILPTIPKHLHFNSLKKTNPHFQGVFTYRILCLLLWVFKCASCTKTPRVHNWIPQEAENSSLSQIYQTGSEWFPCPGFYKHVQ